MSKEIDFATSLDEAKTKYEKYKNIDPFSKIAPALLNSADICDYVRLTGMIYPFQPVDLRPATYGIRLKGIAIQWIYNLNTKKFEKNRLILDKVVTKEKDVVKEFRIERNTISFVTLEPYIQLPNYIVSRFNLKVDHVYKGLLLGTGPVIDPGFRGYLSIPLHNLTNNDYIFRCDDLMIYMEFTKLSNHSSFGAENNTQEGEFVPYPEKPERNVDFFVHEANNGNEITSSLEKIIRDIRETQKVIQKQQKRFNAFNLFSYISIGGIVALFLTFGIFFTNNYLNIKNEVKDNLKQKTDMKQFFEYKTIDSLEKVKIKNQIDSLKKNQNRNIEVLKLGKTPNPSLSD